MLGAPSAGYREINRVALMDTLTRLRNDPRLSSGHIQSIDKWLANDGRLIHSVSEDHLEKLLQSLRSIVALCDAKPSADTNPENAAAGHSASAEAIPEPEQAPVKGTGMPDTFDQSEAARLHKAGIKLVPLHHLRKRPVGNAWNKPEHFVRKVDLTASGYGIPLEANGLCSIDPDQMDMATIALRAVGFDLDKIMTAGVRTTSTRPGSGGRAAFKATDSLKWFSFSVRMAGQKENITIFELRAGSPNLQDCCPGVTYQTVKLVNGKEVVNAAIYTQQYAGGNQRLDAAPELPVGLEEFWEKMSTDPAFRRDTEQKMTTALVAAGYSVEPIFNLRFSGKKLAIECDKALRARFNAAVSVESILSRHDYLAPKRKGDRWASPGSTGAPSIRLIPGHESLWQSDHQSDPLNGTFDAAQASVVLDHGYDVAAFEAWVRERLQGLKQAEATATFSEEHWQGEVAYWDIPADPVTEADAGMSEGSNAEDILSDLILNENDMKGVLGAEHLIPSMVIRGHVGVYPSPPGGGKTTLFIHFCEELARKGYTVYYFNVDSSPEMLDFHLKHAKKHGYHLIAPDMKKGKGLTDARNALVKLTNLPAGVLNKTVIIIDTLKKFVSLLDKREVSAFFKMARAFNAKGATVCILAHTNKYLDQEGNLVFEGVGDVLSDIDEMIYLYSSLDRDTNIREITTDFATGKVRANNFTQRSFRIHLNDEPRRVEECTELLPKFTDESRKVLKVATEIIGGGSMNQRELIAALIENTHYGRDKLRAALHALAEHEHSPLKSRRNPANNNALSFSLRKTGEDGHVDF